MISRKDKVTVGRKEFVVQAFGNGDVRFPYELLIEIEHHLTAEHEIPKNCQLMDQLRRVHMMGCNVAVAQNERNA